MFLALRQFFIAYPGCYMEMHVYNICLEFQIEIKQRYVVSYLHRKGMKLPAIVARLAAVDHKDAFDKTRVKYWLREIMLHCSDLSDRPISGGLPLENINAQIMQVLEAEPCPSVRTSAEFLKIRASRGHLHLTTSLNMKSRHSNGFLIFLMMSEQNDWSMFYSFSTSCRHKRDAIFEV
jgi:hypothetical protein